MTDAVARLSTALADRYRIERELGQGGMATVYLAEDLKHHRRVAIKVLRPELAAALGGDRFSREIHIAAQLQHPHILPLLDSGETGGFLYYVMPYVEGESLRERLAKHGELPVHDAVKILTEVVDALAHAHGRGVVHRDIKPDNVLLSGRHALVTDFGVAKAVSEATGRHQLTTAGMALGTPAYMAPEQAAADPHLDHRVDIYAVGCVGYELLTGRPPFSGLSAQEVLAAHVTQSAEPVERYRQAVPAALSAVVMKCLAKRPADRWQTAEELLAELEPLATPSGGITPTQTRPIAAVPAARFGSRHWLLLVGAAAGVAGVALLGSRLSRPGSPEVRFGRRIQATLSPGLEIHPALSPHGDLLAYTAGAAYRLFVRQVEGGNPIPVAPDQPGTQAFPSWSPDGKQLAFTSLRGVEIIPALGGTPRLLVPSSPGAFTLAGPWSPDGREVAFVRGDTLYATLADGSGAPRVVTTHRELHSCAWSADGSRIACVTGNLPAIRPGVVFGNLAQSAIAVVAADGGPPVKVTEDSSANASPAWLPNGTLLFVSNREGGRDVYAVRLDRNGRATAPPHRLTTGLNAISITVSVDGLRIGYAVFTETSNVWSLPIPPVGVASVRQATQVTSGNQVIESFDISPDGRWLVFDSDRSGNSDLYRMPLGGGEPEQLTRTPVDEFWPSWSPDGREVAFHTFREGRRQIDVISAAGGPAAPVARTEEDDRSPSWSRDGKSLFFNTNVLAPDAGTRMVTRAADGTWGPPTWWRKPACYPEFSPDSSLVACRDPAGGQLLLVRPTGDSLRALLDPALIRHVTQGTGWSSDGRTVYYLGTDSVGANVYAVSVTGGTPRVVVRFDDPTRPWHRYGFRVFRDRFYFTVGDQQSDVWVAEVGVSP